jgi:outer membrane protein assembly factor BamB
MDRQPRLDEDGNPVAAEDTSVLGNERVLCLNASNGELIWQHEYDCPYRIQHPNGPRATPLVDENRLYTLGAMGHLFCFEVTSGKVIWTVDLLKRFEAKPPVWGFACHPLIDDRQLIVMVGGEESAVVALDKLTGATRWQSLTAEEIGYAPPVMYKSNGTRQLIVWHDVAVKSLDPQTGKVLWSVPFPANGVPQRPVVPIMTPRWEGNLLFVSNFYEGAMVIATESDAPGARMKWAADKGDPHHRQGLNVVMSTPFIRDGYVYGVAGNGEIRCLELDTGKLQWKDVSATGKKPTFLATCFLVANEDRFFIFNDQGYLIIAQLTPHGYTELDRTRLLETTTHARGRQVVWSHPAFANRCMYVRNEKELICVNLAASQSE